MTMSGSGGGGTGDGGPLGMAGSLGPPTSAPTAGTTTAERRPLSATHVSARKTGRRARLTLSRVDPWSMLKLSFVYSLAGLIVLLIAVGVLYSIVDAMGVIDSVRSFVTDIESNGDTGITVWFGFKRVILVTLVIGVVNVVLQHLRGHRGRSRGHAVRTLMSTVWSPGQSDR
jgi:hypothetical protein